jgi:hypothetical protein
MQVDRCTFAGWDDCVRLRSETTEVVLLAAAGPRILAFGPRGGENLLFVEPAGAGDLDRWRMYGGHRLWHAPEDPTLSYVPDNVPVDVAIGEGVVRLTGVEEAASGLRKSLEVSLDGDRLALTHRLEQVRGRSRRAPWAITAFGPGGRAWLPRAAPKTHPDALLPDQILVLWPYTDLGDARLGLGSVAVTVDHDPVALGPLKIGAHHPLGWLAWSRGGQLVVQHTRVGPGTYPDLGATHEIYCDAHLVELEALGPLEDLGPGGVATLQSRWWRMDVPDPLDAIDLSDRVVKLGLRPGRLARR